MMSNVHLLILLYFPLPKTVAPPYIHTSYTLSVIYCTTKKYVAINLNVTKYSYVSAL